ncbi:MAG: hypothetical protein FDX18_01420 [Chlorobium sp.]|nr:MAG: hypothetical protein FDX18_01420 [Chlorobium sp.]
MKRPNDVELPVGQLPASSLSMSVAAWYNLNHLAAASPEVLNFISWVDKTEDGWNEENFRLVEPFKHYKLVTSR